MWLPNRALRCVRALPTGAAKRGLPAASRRVAQARPPAAAHEGLACRRRAARPLPEAVIRSVRGASRVAPAGGQRRSRALPQGKGRGGLPPPAAHALLQRSRKEQRGWPRGPAA
jgi:hypothetical protein